MLLFIAKTDQINKSTMMAGMGQLQQRKGHIGSSSSRNTGEMFRYWNEWKKSNLTHFTADWSEPCNPPIKPHTHTHSVEFIPNIWIKRCILQCFTASFILSLKSLKSESAQNTETAAGASSLLSPLAGQYKFRSGLLGSAHYPDAQSACMWVW